jgi:hypothetical protein
MKEINDWFGKELTITGPLIWVGDFSECDFEIIDRALKLASQEGVWDQDHYYAMNQLVQIAKKEHAAQLLHVPDTLES